MEKGERSRRRKYAEAEDSLRGIVAIGNDMAPYGSILNPDTVKNKRRYSSTSPGVPGEKR